VKHDAERVAGIGEHEQHIRGVVGIAVAGHISARPVVLADNPVWSLSTARANAMRRLLEKSGTETDRLRRVTGHANRKPAVRNPLAERNNRIEVILLRSDS